VVICLEQSANDLHMVKLMPLTPIISCFVKIQNGSAFLAPAYPLNNPCSFSPDHSNPCYNMPTPDQPDLHKLVLWSSEWQMLFNIDKCKVLHLGYNKPESHYIMKTTQLQDVTEEGDLGIITSAA